MSALQFVAAVVGAFFVIGIGVGVIIILAFSATRPDRGQEWIRASGRDDAFGGPHDGGARWNEPPADSDNEDDDYPYWPNRD